MIRLRPTCPDTYRDDTRKRIAAQRKLAAARARWTDREPWDLYPKTPEEARRARAR